jgi:hypothetical protein
MTYMLVIRSQSFLHTYHFCYHILAMQRAGNIEVCSYSAFSGIGGRLVCAYLQTYDAFAWQTANISAPSGLVLMIL